jgi:hypothetical protein
MRIAKRNLKKQSQFTRIECCVMRIAITNLKKQSQFPKVQNDTMQAITMVYGDFDK